MGSSNGIGTSELIELLISFIVLTIAFSMINALPGAPAISYDPFDPRNLAIVGIAVGTGFMLHELAHKFVAQRYGYMAEFKMSIWGLALTLLMAVTHFPVLFAAPGAVMIHKTSYSSPQYSSEYNENDDAYWDHLERRIGHEDLWISLAGPMTNIILTAFFIAVNMYLKGSIPAYELSGNLYVDMAIKAFQVNLAFAAFNLIPIDPLDGGKIFRGNPLIWAVVGMPTILFALAVLVLGIYPF